MISSSCEEPEGQLGIATPLRGARRWKNALRILASLNWLMLIAAAGIDCQTRDASTSTVVGAHVTMWLLVAFITLFGLRTTVWEVPFAWPHRLIVTAAAIGATDAISIYFVGICAFDFSAQTDRESTAYLLLSAVSLLTTVAIPLAVISLVILMIRRRRIAIRK